MKMEPTFSADPKYTNFWGIKAFGLMALSICSLLFFIFFISSLKEFSKSAYNFVWDVRYGYKIYEKLDSLDLSDIERKKYKKRPWDLPNEYWKQLKIPKPREAFGGFGTGLFIFLFAFGLFLGFARYTFILSHFFDW